MRYAAHYLDINARNILEEGLKEALELNVKKKPIALICIGTDRYTGDCYGPLIGTQLNKNQKLKDIKILGNCDAPIHAHNIHEIKLEEDYFVIAIDSALGKSVKHIIITDNVIQPGAALNKSLPKMGDISITGIINTNHGIASNQQVIASTRLSLVLKMAELTTEVIEKVLA